MPRSCLAADRGGIGRPTFGRQACLPTGRRAKLNLIMIYVYAISSKNFNYIYVGMTANIENRIFRHNSGRERTTKPYIPYLLLYVEECNNRIEARIREKYWKSGIGKEKLRELRSNLNY
jgi:putative endonuclease